MTPCPLPFQHQFLPETKVILCYVEGSPVFVLGTARDKVDQICRLQAPQIALCGCRFRNQDNLPVVSDSVYFVRNPSCNNYSPGAPTCSHTCLLQDLARSQPLTTSFGVMKAALCAPGSIILCVCVWYLLMFQYDVALSLELWHCVKSFTHITG